MPHSSLKPFRKYPARAVVLFLVVPGVMLVYSWWAHPKIFMNGPITSPHAAFGDDCSTCHEQTAGGLVHGIGSVTDAKCLICHDNEPHHWKVDAVSQLKVLDKWPPERLKQMKVGILGDTYPSEKGYFPSSTQTEKIVEFLAGKVSSVEVTDPSVHYDFHSSLPDEILMSSDLLIEAVPSRGPAGLIKNLQKTYGGEYEFIPLTSSTDIRNDDSSRPAKYVLQIRHDAVNGDPKCTSCHLEHRGRQHLMNASEQPCLECHQNLKKHVPEGHEFENVRSEGTTVTSFVQGNHPDFLFDRYWLQHRKDSPKHKNDSDRTAINFNHRLHLQERATSEDSGKYREQWELTCKSCHEVDAAGEYMKPISFEAHCQKCHELPVEHKLTRESAHDLILHTRSKKALFGEVEISAADSDDELEDELDELEEEEDSAEKKEPSMSEAKAWVEKDLPRDEKSFFVKNGCARCHFPAQENQLRSIVKPTQIPSRWFNHSRFSHSSHDLVHCAECHTEATSSSQTADALLPNVGVCFRCHGPQRHKVDARCTVCHTFHDTRTTSGSVQSRDISDF